MDVLSQQLRTAADDVAVLGNIAADFAALTPAGLLSAQDAITALRGCADRYAALAAGEIAHRSRPELGNTGMAQALGHVSPEAMIQSIAKVTRHEASKLVQLGTILAETEAAEALAAVAAEAAAEAALGAGLDPDAAAAKGAAAAAAALASLILPWQAPLAAALSVGVLSTDSVDAIRRALGDIGPGVTALHLVTACEQLITIAGGLSPEQLYRRARQARDALDEGGIERREKERRDVRKVRQWWDAAGMYCGTWRLPVEEGTIVSAAFEQALSPRRGGPRMVDPHAKASAEELLNDPRSTEQIAADAFVDMIRLAVDADPGTLFGRRRPAVRVIVTDTHLHARAGHGQIEGHPDPVGFPTVERYLCDTGAIAVGFDDDGQCVNVGRNQRLFTEKQRIGMTIRDGGCLFPSCDRPPSWCEAHHINQWERDNGTTDIADGVLLCRRHHLLLHNNHWHIHRNRADYFLKPPPEVDPTQDLILMPSRNPTMHTLRRPTG